MWFVLLAVVAALAVKHHKNAAPAATGAVQPLGLTTTPDAIAPVPEEPADQITDFVGGAGGDVIGETE